MGKPCEIGSPFSTKPPIWRTSSFFTGFLGFL
ncbi:hypothetical protein B23_2527 [Geobacillus thermoleovorans B23]|nr:hypothetical protein B23_2527 [Geobacillus thermoleovorans B23]